MTLEISFLADVSDVSQYVSEKKIMTRVRRYVNDKGRSDRGPCGINDI